MPFIFAILLTALSLLTNYREALPNPAFPTSPPNPYSPPPAPATKYTYTYPKDDQPWGVIQKVGDHTYTMRVQNDTVMTTREELLQAINNLRTKNGSQPLKTDTRLCQYTQERAAYQNQLGKTDAHAGFSDFLENQNGFEKLGFGHLGENSSYGYTLSGVHLVEWIYGSSPEHNSNQLNPAWDHGCAGVFNLTTNIIFATSPL